MNENCLYTHIYQLALSQDVILITSIIKRKEKIQFIKVQILVRKSPTVLDSVVDLIDANQWRIQEFLNGG
jgi:hypothetical protein